MQKMQEMEHLANTQGLPTDRNTLNKLMALHPGINNPMGSSQQMAGRGPSSSSAQAALALSNYQNMFSRQNSMNSNPNSVNQEASSSFNNSNQSPNFHGPAAVLSGSMQILPVTGLSSPRLPTQQQQQQQQLTVSGNSLIQKNNPQPSQGNQVLQQQMIQQLYHEMSNNNTGFKQQQQQSLSGQNGNTSVVRNGMGFGGNTTALLAAATSNVSGSAVGPAPSRSSSSKGASNSDFSAAGGNAGFNQRAPDLPQSLHLQDDIVSDIAQEFLDNGFFNSELDDYGWKA